MSRSTAYPAEMREPAVRLVSEIRDEHDSEWAAMTHVAELLGIGTPETVRRDGVFVIEVRLLARSVLSERRACREQPGQVIRRLLAGYRHESRPGATLLPLHGAGPHIGVRTESEPCALEAQQPLESAALVDDGQSAPARVSENQVDGRKVRIWVDDPIAQPAERLRAVAWRRTVEVVSLHDGEQSTVLDYEQGVDVVVFERADRLGYGRPWPTGLRDVDHRAARRRATGRRVTGAGAVHVRPDSVGP